MKRIFIALAALLMVFWLYAMPATASTTPKPGTNVTPRVPIVIPCSNTGVPYSVYSMAINQTENLTLTFTSTGDGLLSFSANNYQSYWSTQASGSCGNCSMTLPNVTPGALHTVQLALTASANACPATSLTMDNFSLQIGLSTRSAPTR